MPRESIDYEQVTDSHLSKKYNDILGEAMFACNRCGYVLETDPHISNLRAYFSSIFILYKTSFMLFNSIMLDNDGGSKSSLSQILYNKMGEVKYMMVHINKNRDLQNYESFQEIVDLCDQIHMLIVDGLQRRNMLVRMGENEPRGEASVFYWKDKAAFRKGGLENLE